MSKLDIKKEHIGKKIYDIKISEYVVEHYKVMADSEDEALEKLHDLTKEIISDCCIKLFAIGAYAGNADFNYITDCESYEEEKFDV